MDVVELSDDDCDGPITSLPQTKKPCIDLEQSGTPTPTSPLGHPCAHVDLDTPSSSRSLGAPIELDTPPLHSFRPRHSQAGTATAEVNNDVRPSLPSSPRPHPLESVITLADDDHNHHGTNVCTTSPQLRRPPSRTTLNNFTIDSRLLGPSIQSSPSMPSSSVLNDAVMPTSSNVPPSNPHATFLAALRALLPPQARLVSGTMTFFPSVRGHCSGWGCGYRNAQMVMSYLVRSSGVSDEATEALDVGLAQAYGLVLADGIGVSANIDVFQRAIELAWDMGFDPQGRAQLFALRKQWIGTTEICSLLRSLRVRANIHAFVGDDIPRRIFDFCVMHFQEFDTPLFFQHQGHSRTIVGTLSEKDDFLLVADPSMVWQEWVAATSKPTNRWQKLVKRRVGTLASKGL
eukprot:GEMP01031695.1.p1 GENE.GEMP01031695.1~~GEMP01031695.1.p1  ORF type:complete len:403 (+),score=78.16 GEMP01031695.1:116-1324(+)